MIRWSHGPRILWIHGPWVHTLSSMGWGNVCMYVYHGIHVSLWYTYIHTYIHTYIPWYVCMHVCIYILRVYMHAHIHTCIHTIPGMVYPHTPYGECVCIHVHTLGGVIPAVHVSSVSTIYHTTTWYVGCIHVHVSTSTCLHTCIHTTTWCVYLWGHIPCGVVRMYIHTYIPCMHMHTYHVVPIYLHTSYGVVCAERCISCSSTYTMSCSIHTMYVYLLM